MYPVKKTDFFLNSVTKFDIPYVVNYTEIILGFAAATLIAVDLRIKKETIYQSVV